MPSLQSGIASEDSVRRRTDAIEGDKGRLKKILLTEKNGNK
jgi:hypothetical protein